MVVLIDQMELPRRSVRLNILYISLLLSDPFCVFLLCLCFFCFIVFLFALCVDSYNTQQNTLGTMLAIA